MNISKTSTKRPTPTSTVGRGRAVKAIAASAVVERWADDIDERVLNPCIVAGIARNPELDGVTPWEIRNIYPEIYDPLVAQVRSQAAPILVEFGDDARARNILLDRFRDDCIRGAHGELDTASSAAM